LELPVPEPGAVHPAEGAGGGVAGAAGSVEPPGDSPADSPGAGPPPDSSPAASAPAGAPTTAANAAAIVNSSRQRRRPFSLISLPRSVIVRKDGRIF
jgi:hypothetical protein